MEGTLTAGRLGDGVCAVAPRSWEAGSGTLWGTGHAPGTPPRLNWTGQLRCRGGSRPAPRAPGEAAKISPRVSVAHPPVRFKKSVERGSESRGPTPRGACATTVTHRPGSKRTPHAVTPPPGPWTNGPLAGMARETIAPVSALLLDLSEREHAASESHLLPTGEGDRSADRP